MGSVQRKFRRKGMGLKNEGSIVFELKHEHKDWSTNSSSYNFTTSAAVAARVSIVALADF